MSWLNLNQSLSSLKGQITNFASEVLSESPAEDSSDVIVDTDAKVKELDDKCRNQELEIAALQKLTNELQASLQSERLSRKNGVREDESSWYWDPAPQSSKPSAHDLEDHYKVQIRALQDELSTMKERDTIDIRPDSEDELKKLKEENQNLTANLEDLDSQHQQAMERLLSLKKELQKNFEVLKQEHEDLKNANDDYDVEIKSLLAKVGERDKEIESLKAAKSDLDTLHHKYQNLERIHGLLRENAEKFQEENQDLHEEVFKLQEQVTKLELEIEISSKHSEMSNMVPKETYDDLVKELHDWKNRRNSNQVYLDEINIDDNAKSVIENLKREIAELKYKMHKQNETLELGNKSIKSERIMQLYNKYVNFELPVDYVGEIPSPGDNVVIYKLESVFKTVHSFKKEIDSLTHQLSEKNLNNNHLQTQIDDLTTENDFLTTDIQHYERELNEMKKNNDFLISEIAALKNTSKLEPIIETHEDNLATLETELADCNRINKSFEVEIQQIEKELKEVTVEKVVLQENLNDLRTKYSTMLTELDLFKNQSREVEELEQTSNAQKDKSIKDKTDEIHDLKKRLHASNAKNEQLAIDVHIIENDKVLLTKELDELRNTLEEKSCEHKELTGLKVALDSKLEDLEKKLDEVIKHKNEIEDDRHRLQIRVVEFETASSKTAQLYSAEQVAKLQAEKVNLSEELSKVTVENSTLLKTVESLKAEITKWKQQEEIHVAENPLSHNSTAENETIRLLEETKEELKAKNVKEEFLNNEILALREENEKLGERKLQLETELSNTDNKIVHLEQEFDKLIADLNEKDGLIDSLNLNISSNNATLQGLHQNVSDLENTLLVKNMEIERLQHSLNEIQQTCNDSKEKANRTFEELNKIVKEREEISKQMFGFQDEIAAKNTRISDLTMQIEEINESNNNHSRTIDAKDKEIKELNQSIVELTDKLKVTENITHQNDEYAGLVQEKETIEKEVIELKNAAVAKDNELLELKGKSEQLEKACVEYKTILDNSTAEKNELINLINLKHNESIQYHNEIQRLNHVLLEQTNEFKKAIEERDQLVQNHNDSCSNCERLRITLKEKDEIIMSLTQIANDHDRLKEELRVVGDKCVNLDKSVAIQLEAVKKLTAENVQLSEQEQNSSRELERLRHHLVEMEESYTQELMTSEQKLTECQARLHQVEERAKQTSTVYTSNSIRANQEVETLRNQIKLLEKQREDVQGRLSEAEDARSRSEAALINLQVVLEQFQQDKDRDVNAATEKIRNKMQDLKRENYSLQDEIARLNAKLEESLAGLQAASRLGDQVEIKTAQINDLKEQVRTLQMSVSAAEERYYNAISNQQDKVDKNLVKNLVINYVITAANNNHNKTQVLRILSTVLDFNQQECERLGLVRAGNATDSLAAEFVKFLQNESRPRAPLPDMMALAQPASRSTTPASSSRKSSTIGSHPFEPSHKRNPSTGSNNLLFQNLDDSSSQRSDPEQPRVVGMDTGVNQTRNTESAILKHVLKDM